MSTTTTSVVSYEDGMLDITGADEVEITIGDPIGGGARGSVIHVNMRRGCVLRICRVVGGVNIIDQRKKKTRIA